MRMDIHLERYHCIVHIANIRSAFRPFLVQISQRLNGDQRECHQHCAHEEYDQVGLMNQVYNDQQFEGEQCQR